MTIAKSRLSKQELCDTICRGTKQEELAGFLESRSTHGTLKPAALALSVVQDLYSENSSDEANINRITTNLEALADDLLGMSRQLKTLVR